MSKEKDGCCTTRSGAGDACCGSQTPTLVVACSGASNAGQVWNSMMIELGRKGLGNAHYLAHRSLPFGFTESAKRPERSSSTVPNGCRKRLEKYAIEPSLYFVVTDLGIAKVHTSIDCPTKQALF